MEPCSLCMTCILSTSFLCIGGRKSYINPSSTQQNPQQTTSIQSLILTQFNSSGPNNTFYLFFKNKEKTTTMKLSIFSTLAMVALASAFPHEKRETTDAQCVKPYLCCGELKTPLDDTVDPILMGLGINAASIVGSIGLDCKLLLPF